MKFTLKSVTQIINDNTPRHIMAYIKETYEDYGLGIKWNTIVIADRITGDSYQALSPRLHDKLVNGDDIALDEIQELIDTAIRLCKGA